MSTPDRAQCKANAINALARVADLDPVITGEPRNIETVAILVGIAQVWATLAIVPDPPTPPTRGTYRSADHPKPDGAGSAQWHG